MMISGNLASAYISGSHESSYEVLMWVRVMCGLGSGSLAAIINIALSKTQNSDRAFAYLLFAQLSFSALGIYLFPNVIASVGSVNVIFMCSQDCAYWFLLQHLYGLESCLFRSRPSHHLLIRHRRAVSSFCFLCAQCSFSTLARMRCGRF